MRTETNKRYILIVLLFFHTVNTYMDRIAISAASGLIQTDLGITSQMMGYVFGIFALGYALFQIPSGMLADHYGPRKALSWIVAAWSFFTALTGAAWNAVSLLVMRFFFGVGEAGAFPGAATAVYNWIPARERGMANGIFHSGARVGAAMSLFLMPFLIRLVGWRATFLINGLLGIVWLLFWLYWFRDKPREKKNVSESEINYIEEGLVRKQNESKTKLPLAQILTSSNMLLIMFQYIASNITFFISFTWLLPYLISQWGEGAEIFAPIPLLCGMFAQWISGWLSTMIYSAGFPVNSRKIPAITGFLISVIGLVLLVTVGVSTPLGFTLLFSIAVFGVEMTISPSWSVCMDIGKEKSGTISATMNMLGNLGSAFSAVIFPFFVDRVTIPLLATSTGTANSFFVFAATINLLAALAWVFISPSKKLKIKSPQQLRMRYISFLLFIFIATTALILYRFLI